MSYRPIGLDWASRVKADPERFKHKPENKVTYARIFKDGKWSTKEFTFGGEKHKKIKFNPGYDGKE